MAIILNLFLYSLISIKARSEWWSFPAYRLRIWKCAACSDISHTLGVIIIDEYGEIVESCLLVVENKGSRTNSTTATTMILSWSHPGLNPRLHHINPLFKLPELCHGDVTIMVLRLYTVLFHIDVSYIKFYICGFQMQILWQKQGTCWWYVYDPHV